MTKIKSLEAEIEQLQNKQALLKLEQSSIQSDIDKIKHHIRIEQQVLKVSDHAMIRYLERKLDLNMDSIRDEILNDKLRALTETVGKTGKFTINDMQVVMKDGVVVTLY